MIYTVDEMAQKLGVPASTAGHPLRAVLAPLQAAGNAYILGGENLLTGCAYKRRWAYYCKDLGMVQSGCFLRHFYDILKK